MAEQNPTTRPWCPFCGQNIEKPREPVQRKMDEFTMGVCQCGAVYTCDATGHNVGSAMVECLVHACNDNWDLAWDLIPEEDYLTGRLENYDEVTNQVLPQGNLDGRYVRGVLYFVRLQKDIAEISKLWEKKKPAAPAAEPEIAEEQTAGHTAPALEPEKDPKRKKKRANKNKIKELMIARDIDGLVDFAFDDLRTLRFMQRMLYDPLEDNRWLYAWIIGQVCRRLSTRKPGAVSDMLHRLYDACTDSAATHWGLLETVGSIIAARPDIFGGFARHMYMFRGAPSNRVIVLWALGTVAAVNPDIIRGTPIYSLFSFIPHPDSFTRGHAVRLFGNIQASEVKGEIEKLIDDQAKVTVYEEGLPVYTTVGKLAGEALNKINSKE